MPWEVSVPLFLTNEGLVLDVTEDLLPHRPGLPGSIGFDEFYLDLYEVVGEPDGPVDLIVNVSGGANIGSLRIDSRFHILSTFQINLTTAARVVGRGGVGGKGALDWNNIIRNAGDGSRPVGGIFGQPTLFPAAAIESAFDFSLEMDAGYVLGGGGGGGGGGALILTPARLNGGSGGGGGGIGWNEALGGASGSGARPNRNQPPDSWPPGGAGIAGTIDRAGFGRVAAYPNTLDPEFAQGGNGGTYGAAGDAGEALGNSSEGTGGVAGRSIQGWPSNITVTLLGVKSEATLISENRLLGATNRVTVV